MADQVDIVAAMIDVANVTIDNSKEEEDRSGYVDILRQHHLFLMQKLDPQLFMDMLDPFLTSQIHEKMTKEETTRQLLQNLSRGPVEMFDKFCKVIAGLNPDIFQQLQGREPTREESDFFFKSFYEDLCAGIIKAGSKTDNEVDKRIDLDTQFANLKLTDRQFDEVNSTVITHKETGSESSDTDEECNEAQGHQVGTQTPVDENIDVAEILPQDFSGKSVLLQGCAGVGKSTLTQYVAREWAKGRWGASFTGVFLLNLRKLVHVRQEMSLSQLLGMYAEYVTGAPDPNKPSVEWLEQNAEKVLIFTDGIDELPELSKLLKRTPKLKTLNLKATPLDWCINLIQKNVLPQCTTIVVSRPFIGLRNLKYDREIEVFGLTPDMVMQFVDRNVESNRKEAVKETLSKNPLLLSVCTITFYCAAICKVLEQDTSLDGASLTTYTRIAAYIITKFVSRNTAEECALSVIPEEFLECLTEMSALAYHGLLGSGQDNTRLVFDQTDFNQVGFTPNRMKAAKQTGLLLYKDVKTPHSPQLPAEFVHLSVQEFLAMASLAKAGEDEIRQFFKSSLGRFSMSKLFAFGLFLDKENAAVKAICQAVMRNEDQHVQQGNKPIANILVDIFQEMCKELNSDGKSWLTLMHIAYESQRADLALAVGKAVAPEGEFELTHRQLTLIDLRAIFFCLTHAKVHRVTCSHILVDEVHCQEIQGYLEKATEEIKLEFQCTTITDEGMVYLADGIKSSQMLSNMKFVDNYITDDGMDKLSKGITCSTSLRSLGFLYSDISEEGFRLLSEGFNTSKSLRYLKLGNLDITEMAMAYLSSGIQHSRSIETLHLKEIDFTDAGTQSIQESIGSERKFRARQSNHNNQPIKACKMQHFSDGIREARKVTDLILEGCKFGFEGMMVLAEGIQAATNLTHLQFDSYVFYHVRTVCIFQAIFASKSLRKLHFNYCHFEECAMEQLSNAIASSGIEYIGLQGNVFKGNMKHLPNGFAVSRSLVHLKWGGDLNDETMRTLSDCIAVSKSLTQLELESILLSRQPMMFISEAIASSTCLEHLQIHGCHLVQGDELLHLSRALTRTKVLKLVVFKRMTFSDEAMQHLSEGIAASRSLIGLEFLSCRFSAEGIMRVFKGIQVARHLESVQFIQNKTTKEGQELLAQCILDVPASCKLVV